MSATAGQTQAELEAMRKRIENEVRRHESGLESAKKKLEELMSNNHRKVAV